MTKWQRHLNVKDVWKSGDVPLIAKTLSKRLAALTPFDDESLEMQREGLIERFSDLAAQANATTGDFNDILSDLYDWGDTKLDWTGKRVCCWIATSF